MSSCIKDRRGGKREVNCKKVIQCDFYTGESIGEYDSIAAAAYDNYIDVRTITRSIRDRGGICPRLMLRFKYIK